MVSGIFIGIIIALAFVVGFLIIFFCTLGNENPIPRLILLLIIVIVLIKFLI